MTYRDRLPAPIRRLADLAGIDRAILAGIAARVWDILTGPVTLVLIAAYFSPELQGYYFTFSSLLFLRTFAELHMGRVILHAASHEWSSLGLDADGRIMAERDPDAYSRLVSLGHVAFTWYGVATVLFILALSAGGYLFLAQSPTAASVDWVMPWFALCVTSGLSLFTLAPVNILNGCNQVNQVYEYRLYSGMVTVPATWIAIASGTGLWAAAASAGAGLVVDAIFIGWRYRRFFRSFLSRPPGPRVSWWGDIWPLQWRFGAVGISDYFVSSLFTPVLFHYRGAVEAGQMGMTWRILGAVSATSYTWTNARAPQFGMYAAKGDYRDLDRLYLRTTVTAVVVTLVGGVAILALPAVSALVHFPVGDRLLPLVPTILFLLAAPLTQVYLAQLTYLRSHKREMFATLALAQGALIGLSTWFFGSRYGATGIGAGYLAVTALVVMPWATTVWRRCRREWHAPGSAPAAGPAFEDAVPGAATWE